MTITSPLELSPAFVEAIDPTTCLQQGLVTALARGELGLVFMQTEPPSPEECKLGIQVIDHNKLPERPLLSMFRSKYQSYDRPWYYNGFTGMSSRVGLVPDDWAHLHDVLAAQTGGEASADPATALSLLPKAPNKVVQAQFTDDFDKCGDPAWLRHRYQWALLVNYKAFSSRERLWVEHNNGTSIRYYTEERKSVYADKLLFDFRGAIPLTVGPRGSTANVWLDALRGRVESGVSVRQNWLYPNIFDIARIHVPVPETTA